MPTTEEMLRLHREITEKVSQDNETLAKCLMDLGFHLRPISPMWVTEQKVLYVPQWLWDAGKRVADKEAAERRARGEHPKLLGEGGIGL